MVFRSQNNCVALSGPLSSSSNLMLSEVLTPGLGSIPALGSWEHLSPPSTTHIGTASSLEVELLSLGVVNWYLPSLLHHQDIPDKASSLASLTLCLALDVHSHTEQLTCCVHPLQSQHSHTCANTYTAFVSLAEPLGNTGPGTDTFSTSLHYFFSFPTPWWRKLPICSCFIRMHEYSWLFTRSHFDFVWGVLLYQSITRNKVKSFQSYV